MGDIIYLEKRKEWNRKRLIDDIENHMTSLDDDFISRLLLESHPVSKNHAAQGRIFYANILKEYVFHTINMARKAGFTDIQVERTALKASPRKLEIMDDCFAVYGRPSN